MGRGRRDDWIARAVRLSGAEVSVLVGGSPGTNGHSGAGRTRRLPQARLMRGMQVIISEGHAVAFCSHRYLRTLPALERSSPEGRRLARKIRRLLCVPGT